MSDLPSKPGPVKKWPLWVMLGALAFLLSTCSGFLARIGP